MNRFVSRPGLFPSTILLLCFVVFTSQPVRAHPAAEEMAAAANNFLAALNPEQHAKAVYEMKDEERFDWHFIPKARKGLPIKEMTPSQRNLAHALLSTGLSQSGYVKATTIMSLEQVLYDMEKQAGPTRDAELYYFTVFGAPGKAAWGWRVEGHHVSLNFTVAGSEVLAVTPSFMGSNAGEIREGPRKGLRVLGAEEDSARQLVKSLDEGQLKTALVTNVAPREIITSNDRKAHSLEPAGIAMGALNFFRSLASAFIVAVLGAILLAGLGVAPERGGRAISVIETVSAAGTDVALVFRFVFLAAFVFLALSLVFLVLMEERPLRGNVIPVDPPAAPPPAG